MKQRSRSLLSLLREQRLIAHYSSGISKLDCALLGSNGFQQSQLYDLNCVPGAVGKWELIFHLILLYLDGNLPKRVLVLQTWNKIPWFKLQRCKAYRERSFKSKIDVATVESLAELVVFLQSFDFKGYGLVIIDEFQGLYKACQVDIKGQYTGGRKRDALGKPLFSPIKKLDQTVAELLMFLTSLAKQHQLIFITTGKLDVFNQRIRQEELASEEEEDSDPSIDTGDPKFFVQRILVPIISLQNSLSDFYANRIILYNDWIVTEPTIKSGLDKSLSINEYIRILERKHMNICPHFLSMSSSPNSDGEKPFVEGWFHVDEETFDIIDDEGSIEKEKPLTISAEVERLLSSQVEESEIPDSQ